LTLLNLNGLNFILNVNIFLHSCGAEHADVKYIRLISNDGVVYWAFLI
jgi:hypothetical protein